MRAQHHPLSLVSSWLKSHFTIIIAILPTAVIGESSGRSPRPSLSSFLPRKINMPEKQWFPLESNPQLLNQYISNLGFSTTRFRFIDVYSTDDWALEMIHPPVLSCVVLFPTSDKILGRREEMHRRVVSIAGNNDDVGVWYIKQRIRNACGTIAILHALANIPIEIQSSVFMPSTWIENFLKSCNNLSPTEKAFTLENDNSIETYHDAATNDDSNQTNRPESDDNIDMHFATFACIDNQLYELDGRLDGPIRYGKTSREDFLKDTCSIVRDWMQADKNDLRFTMMALASIDTE